MRDTYATDKWNTPLMFTPMEHADESSIFARATFTYDTDAWITLTARDDDDCVELQIFAMALDAESGQVFTEENAPHEWSFESPACEPGAPVNSRPLLQWHGGSVTPAKRTNLYALDPENPSDYRQVKRTFRWPMQVRKTPATWTGSTSYADIIRKCTAVPEMCTKIDCRSTLSSSPLCASAINGTVYAMKSASSTLGSCDLNVMWAAKEVGDTWWLKCPNARELPGVDVTETEYEAQRYLWNTGELDARPEHSYVCFVASDGYLLSPYKCVHIQLVSKGSLRWMDDRNWDTDCIKRPEMPTWAAGDTPVNNTEFWVAPGNTLQVELSAYDASGGLVTIEQVRGQPLKEIRRVGADIEWLPLERVYNSSRDISDSSDAVMWNVSQALAPRSKTFESGDPLNLHIASVSGRDPLRTILRFTPKGGSECSYKLCFQARSQNGQQAIWQHEDGDLEMKCNITVADERCFTIHVADQAAKMAGAAFNISATAALTRVSLDPEAFEDCSTTTDSSPKARYGGITYSMWVYPTSDYEICDTPMQLFASYIDSALGERISPQRLIIQQHCASKMYSLLFMCFGGDALDPSLESPDLSVELLSILQPGEWHHIRIEMSGANISTVSVYVDGELAGESVGELLVASTASSPSRAGVIIGGIEQFAYHGYIADFAIYNSTFGDTASGFDHISDYDRLPLMQLRRLVGFWRMSDGVRNLLVQGIGNAHLQAPIGLDDDVPDQSTVAYLQYPWWDRYRGGKAPLSTGHAPQASYQHAIQKYQKIERDMGIEAAMSRSLLDPEVALMSIRTSEDEMRVTNPAHLIKEASGASGISTAVLSAGDGSIFGDLTYTFLATPGSGICIHAALPNTLLAHTPGECLAVFATHERAFAPGLSSGCQLGTASVMTNGVPLREPGSDTPWAAALKCCFEQPQPVQRVPLMVSNSLSVNPSRMSVPVGFLDMSLLVNVDLSTLESSRLVYTTPKDVPAASKPINVTQHLLLDKDESEPRIIDGDLVVHTMNEVRTALTKPFNSSSQVFPTAVEGQVVMDANLVGLQYVRADTVLDDLETATHGFSTEGWFYPVHTQAATAAGHTWLVGWTGMLNCSDQQGRSEGVGAATGLTRGAAVYIASDGHLQLIDRSEVGIKTFPSQMTVASNTWHHILISVTADLTGAIFLDGIEALTFRLSETPEALLNNSDVHPATFAIGGIRWHDPSQTLQSKTGTTGHTNGMVQMFSGMNGKCFICFSLKKVTCSCEINLCSCQHSCLNICIHFCLL
jgi:hypothetical protein